VAKCESCELALCLASLRERVAAAWRQARRLDADPKVCYVSGVGSLASDLNVVGPVASGDRTNCTLL